MDVEEQLRAKIEELNRDRAFLEEENRALAIRAEGVEILSKMLEHTQKEANELRGKLATRLADDGSGMAQAKAQASNGGSFEKSRSEGDISLDVSPWNTVDTSAMDEIQKELCSLLQRNKDLAMQLEATLQEQEGISGDDQALVEQLNRLKAELEKYQVPSKLRDEANRLKNKLTDIAVRRGTTCGKLQKEIDSVKLKLRDIENRISPYKTDTTSDFRNDCNIPQIFNPQSKLSDPFSLEFTEMITDELSNKDAPRGLPAVKPRQDVKEMKDIIEMLRVESTELKKQIDELKAEKVEIIKVNHSWDARYKKLQELFKKEIKERDSSYHKLQRELSFEHKNAHASVKDLLEQKDKHIEDQSKQIRELQEELTKVRSEGFRVDPEQIPRELEAKYKQAKKLFFEQKREKEITMKREEAALEECQMLRDAVDILERESKALVSRNRTLTEEIQRLTIVIGAASPGQSRSSPPSFMDPGNQGLGRQRSVVSEEQIEVLKQQIAIYAEDFNSEREEKEKIAEQVKRVTAKLRETEKKCRSLENELKIKEERLRTTRYGERYQPLDIYDDLLGPGYANVVRKPASQLQEYKSPEEARNFQEYRQLLEDKYRINERMTELENRGSDRFSPRRQDYYGNMMLVGRDPTQLGMMEQNNERESSSEMYVNGHVVKDGGKLPLGKSRSFEGLSEFGGFGIETGNFRNGILN
ncbi:TNFAIP3-interacting protein 1-like [Rhopilema esculentum]|uniref:TNFAIP3-interacting protein 1-like n=1 Tax=Rhopilema esculentum TaxID=499914 RepID=UPI0031E38CD8